MHRNPKGYRVGQDHQKAVLSDSDVARMRSMYKPGVIGYLTLARIFHCGESTARDICTFRTRPPSIAA